MSIWRFTWRFLHFTVIVHDINSSFDCDPTQDVRGIFLDVLRLLIKYGMRGFYVS